MNTGIWIAVYPLALLGHMALWIALFNRLHATNTPVLLRKVSYLLVGLALINLPLLLVVFSGKNDWRTAFWPESFGQLPIGLLIYIPICLVFAVVTVAVWLFRKKIDHQNPRALLSSSSEDFDFGSVSRVKNDSAPSLFKRIPGNQIYRCRIEKRELNLPGLHHDLQGISIAHLSDTHFNGRVCRDYFQKVIDQVNRLSADIVVLTGDIIDAEECWEWIQSVLARLRAPRGIYYVLGNHDRKIKDTDRLREALGAIGFQCVADRWRTIPVGESRIHLAGNELPWFGKAIDQVRALPDNASDDDLCVLLTHSPDQWSWARRLGFQLTLAGHTHGGQIRLPVVGPIISPSRHGVKYASGIFERDGQVMIVSRGISGEEPIRLNCLPEVGLITLGGLVENAPQ